MRRVRSLRLVGGLVLGIAALLPRSAKADVKAACVASSEEAQQLRSEGKLIAAREKLLACARDVCPAIVRKDCSDWLVEVDRSVPSVVPSAKDGAGHDVVAAQVSVDGKKVASSLDGRAIPVDPGAHVLRFEAANGQSVEERVIVREGEHNRPIIVLLGPAADPNASRNATSDGAGSRAGVPVASIVLAGVGVVALGSFAFFGASGKSDVSDMRTSCAPNCTDDVVHSARTKLIVADVSLGVGVVSIATAAVLFFARGDGDSASARGTLARPRLDAGFLPGGASASLTGRF